MTKRPRGYPRRAWFHLSRSQRKITKWFLAFGMEVGHRISYSSRLNLAQDVVWRKI